MTLHRLQAFEKQWTRHHKKKPNIYVRSSNINLDVSFWENGVYSRTSCSSEHGHSSYHCWSLHACIYITLGMNEWINDIKYYYQYMYHWTKKKRKYNFCIAVANFNRLIRLSYHTIMCTCHYWCTSSIIKNNQFMLDLKNIQSYPDFSTDPALSAVTR